MSILGALTGLAGPLTNLASKYLELQTARTSADTDVKLKDIDREIEEVQSKRSILLAEAGQRFASIVNNIVRLFFASCAAIFIAKILVWDKVIGAFMGCAAKVKGVDCSTFRTDGIEPNMWWLILAIVSFYFLATYRK